MKKKMVTETHIEPYNDGGFVSRFVNGFMRQFMPSHEIVWMVTTSYWVNDDRTVARELCNRMQTALRRDDAEMIMKFHDRVTGKEGAELNDRTA